MDLVLEEAVQSLPVEQPFQSVDRIEYMRREMHRRDGDPEVAAAAEAEANAEAEAEQRGSRRRGDSEDEGPQQPHDRPQRRQQRRRQRRQRRQRQQQQPTAWQPPPLDPGVFNLTLVTQADTSRLHVLAECARRWRHPIVASILLPVGYGIEDAVGDLTFGSHVNLLPFDPPDDLANASYPINRLRNAAIRAVRTSHYLVLDVDLWPSELLHAAAMSLPASLLSRKYAALVVPAFQV